MTKSIRIENADNSNWPVRLTTEDKQADGSWKATSTQQINTPTELATLYITSGRRIVIEERVSPEEERAPLQPPPAPKG